MANDRVRRSKEFKRSKKESVERARSFYLSDFRIMN